MKFRSSFLITLLGVVSFCSTVTGFANRTTGIRGSRRLDPSSILCLVLSVDTMYDTDDETDEYQEFKCILVTNQTSHHTSIMYSLDLPSHFVDAYPHLTNGEVFVAITNARSVWEPDSMMPPFIEMQSDSAISLVKPSEHDRRRLEPRHTRTHGNKTVLVLRVTTVDGIVELSKETLSARIFGIGENVPHRTVVSQYGECSFGKLNLVPAEGEGIVNGVAEIFIPTNSYNVPADIIEPLVVQEAETALGVDDLDANFDHIIFVYPSRVIRRNRPGWIAFAIIGGQRTYFNNENAGYFSVVMHEIGHNFGLYHSQEFSHPYGDTSGLMGSSYQIVGLPNKCFNGHKNWLLGWFQDKTTTIDINDGAWTGNIAAFTQYDTARQEDFIIVNVGDLYLQYNRADKFNVLTGDDPNQITIVQGKSPDERSILLGAVSRINSFDSKYPVVHRVADFQGSGFDLIIEACEQNYLSRVDTSLPDYIRISLHLQNGRQASACNRPTLPPTSTPAPTMRPTALTPRPTSSPTPAPTIEKSPPTTSPTASLEITHHEVSSCDDSHTGSFFVEEVNYYGNCAWLSKSPAWKKRLCIPGHVAWNMCEETCGKCEDTCVDLAGAFFLTEKEPERDCAWLSTRYFNWWRTWACDNRPEVYELCRETCRRC